MRADWQGQGFYTLRNLVLFLSLAASATTDLISEPVRPSMNAVPQHTRLLLLRCMPVRMMTSA